MPHDSPLSLPCGHMLPPVVGGFRVVMRKLTYRSSGFGWCPGTWQEAVFSRHQGALVPTVVAHVSLLPSPRPPHLFAGFTKPIDHLIACATSPALPPETPPKKQPISKQPLSPQEVAQSFGLVSGAHSSHFFAGAARKYGPVGVRNPSGYECVWVPSISHRPCFVCLCVRVWVLFTSCVRVCVA